MQHSINSLSFKRRGWALTHGLLTRLGELTRTLILGRRGLRNVLWLAKHGAELPPSGYPHPTRWWTRVDIATWFVAWCWPLVATCGNYICFVAMSVRVSEHLGWYANEWLLVCLKLPRTYSMWPEVWMWECMSHMLHCLAVKCECTRPD